MLIYSIKKYIVADSIINIISNVCKKSFTKAMINCFVLLGPKYIQQKIRDKGKVIKNKEDMIQNLIKPISLKEFSF